MRVFQVGAAGGVGLRLARLSTAQGDMVTGMHRNPAQGMAIEEAGATAISGDLITDSVKDLAAKVDGHDVVVFSAGAHGTGAEQTTLIDGDGVDKMIQACTSADVGRFILVSVFPDALRGGERNVAFEHYMKVKKAADIRLAHAPLDWMIVRPGTLLDTPGTGLVAAGPALAYGDIPRDDVAAFIAAVLHRPPLRDRIVELTSGVVPVAEAAALL